MRIVLPWPSAKLSPNAKRRTHWRVYQPVAKQARWDAHILTLDAMQQQGLQVSLDHYAYLPHIPVTVTFYPPDRRHRDDDGMIGALKHARDGIADALQVDDRRFRTSYVVAEPCKPGRVEVVIEGLASEPEM